MMQAGKSSGKPEEDKEDKEQGGEEEKCKSKSRTEQGDCSLGWSDGHGWPHQAFTSKV